MNFKLTGILVLLLATAFGTSSCSLFGGGKKKSAPRRSGPTFMTSDSPMLGAEGPNLGTSKERR